MSFILDALRKSENERQRETTASLTRAPLATARRETPVWTWLVIGMLALALVASAAAWWRSSLERPRAEPALRLEPDARDTANSASAAGPGPAPAPNANAVARPVDTAPRPIVRLTDIDPALPDYSLEFFAFTDGDPSGGNAWIGGRRYVPGERIANGPEIVAIRRDGILLSYGGHAYLLKPH